MVRFLCEAHHSGSWEGALEEVVPGEVGCFDLLQHLDWGKSFQDRLCRAGRASVQHTSCLDLEPFPAPRGIF